MQHNRTATVKVGLLTIISLMVLITTVIWLRGRTLGGGQGFEVYFKDVDGLREGAPVQFMGIRVGFVDEVTPTLYQNKQYRVKVRFTITQPNIQVPKGSSISLEQSGIIGEKFMELTPPRPELYELELPERVPQLRSNLPIMVPFKTGLVKVGTVQAVSVSIVPKILKKTPDYKYQLVYVIDKPGYLPPTSPEFRFVHNEASGKNYLLLMDPQTLTQLPPSERAYFTLEEPLRLKAFLEEQLASAEALKTTNEKINMLLSDETISTIQGTIKNSERLTAEATKVLGQANKLFASTANDLKVLVGSTQKLTDSVVEVSNNINDLAGNPELKANIEKTVQSVEASTAALSTLLNDPELRLMLSDARVTSQNAAQLMTYLREMMVDKDFQGRMDTSLTLLNGSLTELSSLLESLKVVSEDKETIQAIIQDTHQTTQNLNRFSEKLNKHFLLFRLLF